MIVLLKALRYNQIMRLYVYKLVSIVGAGFTPTEADELRRSMATFKAKGLVKQFQDKLVNGMLEKGCKRDKSASSWGEVRISDADEPDQHTTFKELMKVFPGGLLFPIKLVVVISYFNTVCILDSYILFK